jgi:SecD/SecF fusion protein
MLIGVITGTYSSIFVASPVLVDFDRKNKLVTAEEAKAQARKANLEAASAARK